MTGRDDAPRSPDPVSASLILGLAVGLFGVSFGVLAVAAGLTVWQALTMSLLVFTGASQFAAVAVVSSGGTEVAALGSALLLAARNGAYGLALSDVLKGDVFRRLVAAHLVLDESTAMATAQRDPDQRERAFWLAGVSVFVSWNVGTMIGGVWGDAIGDVERWGLDAAFPAGFVALVAPHLHRLDARVAAALAVAIALVLVPIVPVGIPVLASSLAVLVGLRVPPREVGRKADRR